MPEQHLTLSVHPRGLRAWLFGVSVVVDVVVVVGAVSYTHLTLPTILLV